MTKYDCIVVGAGPGGSAFSKIAVENGLKVLMLERARTPGEKNTSGSTIWGNIARTIHPDFPADAPIERQVDGGRLYFVPEGKEWEAGGYSMLGFSHPSKKVCDPLNVYRNVFDKWWAEQTVAIGAELKTQTLVTGVLRDSTGKIIGVIDEKGEKYESEIVIGADGVLSIIGRMAGLRPMWGSHENCLCCKIDWELDQKLIDERFGSSIEHNNDDIGVLLEIYFAQPMAGNAGYFWIFPDRGSLALGLGIVMNDLIRLEHNIWWYMWNSINHPIVQPKLKGGKPRSYIAHSIPLTNPVGPNGTLFKSYGDGIMLIGDAAGFTCPIDGAGWCGAVSAGKIAAEIAIRAIESGDTSAASLQRYERKWVEGDVGKNLKMGKEMADWLTHESGGINVLADQLTNDMASLMEHETSHEESMGGTLTRTIRHAQEWMALSKPMRMFLGPYLQLFSSLMR
ncbi:MAG TPA: NAD(P)/FAD-dependent oxidoreductase [Candidatus Deferrimicrobium sp.]|nr:NAD(P)/FAD-dependent oxidoreductase [Candidatus Deferrimicrobium sp.]